MRRVPEVLDCWFESGSMPFAQVHYPFENADWFESHYPGDFIVEYIGQTRGWFYTLHVLATALFDRPAFRTCVSHGIVLGDDGLKMSKSLRNYPDPMEVFDSLRRRRDALVPAVVADPARRRLLGDRGRPARHRPPGAPAAVERVVLPHAVRQRRRARTAACATARAAVDRTCSTATSWPRPASSSTTSHATMDAYDLFGACAAVRSFLDDPHQLVHPPQPSAVLGRRRRRHRHAAHRARRARAGAPRRCCRSSPEVDPRRPPGRATGAACTSRDWPIAAELPADDDLVAAMDEVRDVCSATLSVRKAHGRRVRQPLSSLTVAVPDAERAGARSSTSSPTRSTSATCSSPTTSSAVAGNVLQVVPGGARARASAATPST